MESEKRKFRSSYKPNINVNKAKSCTGCLYYSSHFKGSFKSPICIGITRTLPEEAPQYEVGRTLRDFRYGCLGYSVYKRKGEGDAEQPRCIGLRFVEDDRRVNNDASTPMAHVHNREEENGLPKHGSVKPTKSTGDDYLYRLEFNWIKLLVPTGVLRPSDYRR
ncbi:hypothetical protein CASFOL_018623 [Castilleja foliolosa]|uniref:DUF8204 domain-containing protein n=1 Tax=Castilleja foliolosa TaxID=1961234 RepID=A0ABD3D581_9LAMI